MRSTPLAWRRPALPRTPVDVALAGVGMAIGVAWLVAIGLELTGHAAALHHHALIEPGAPPLWIGLPAFLAAWLLMVVGMMLPASMRAIEVAIGSRVTRPRLALGGFFAAYALVWLCFGLVAFVGDMGLHALVHAWPWLAARPFLIEAAVLALAGGYQFAAIKRRGLEACRHPQPVPMGDVRHERVARTRGQATPSSVWRTSFHAGLGHALDCVASSWALMLLMFAAGVANLVWMAVLAAAMAYEALGRHGRRFALAFGGMLLWLALVAATGVTIAF